MFLVPVELDLPESVRVLMLEILVEVMVTDFRRSDTRLLTRWQLQQISFSPNNQYRCASSVAFWVLCNLLKASRQDNIWASEAIPPISSFARFLQMYAFGRFLTSIAHGFHMN